MEPIIFKEGRTKGTWFLDRSSIKDKKIKSITKLFGGPEYIHKTRHYECKGCGGWITDFFVKDKDRQFVTDYVLTQFIIKWVSQEDIMKE